MLSNKWTFSLKILVVMLALAFVGHTAMAAEFAVTLSVGPDVDISSPDGIQAAYGAMLLRLILPRVQWCNLLLPLLKLLVMLLLKQPREQQRHSSS